MGVQLAGNWSDSFTPSGLILSEMDVVTESITVSSGQNLAALTVVGRITSTGEIVICDPAQTDGSQNALGILVNAIDATSADKPGTIYTGGHFDRDLLVWHAGFSTDLLKAKAFDRTNIKTSKRTYSVG